MELNGNGSRGMPPEVHQAWDELQEIRDKYLILHDFAPAGYVTLNTSGLILEANLTLAKLLGVEKPALIGSELAQYIDPGSREIFLSHLKNTLESGVRQTCEVRMQKHGSPVFFAGLDSMAVRDPDGHLSRCYTIVTDISDRRKYEEMNRFKSTLSEISPDAIIAADKGLNITHWNKAAETILGWSAGEVLGQEVSTSIRAKILSPLTGDEVMQSLAEKGSWNGEVSVYRKDGTEVRTLASIGVLWDEAGHFNGIVAVHRELTPPSREVLPEAPGDRVEMKVKQRTEELINANRLLQQELRLHRQAALAAKEAEGRNRDLVDNIKLGIFRCTPGAHGKFLEVNKAMEEMSGYNREELLRIGVCDLYFSPDDADPFTNEINVNDWKFTRELNLKKKDGSFIIIAMTVVAIRFESGTTRYFDGILEDITERKQAQSQIQQSLERLQKTIREIIEAMAYIGEVRDPYTAGHQRRVAQLSLEIARTLSLKNDQYEGLTMAAYVHDIGKILVPADILSKPGKLTRPEFDMLKDHPRIGYEILKTIEFPWPIATIVLQHHERINGSGYPSGLSGDQIIIEARILAVADVVEAMSSHRPYRPALGIQQALDEITQNRGILYDPEVVDACYHLFNEKGFSLS